VPILSKMNPTHSLPPNLFQYLREYYTRPCQWSISSCIFRLKYCTYAFKPCLMPRLSRPPCVEPNNIRWRVQIMKLLIMQFSQTPVTSFLSEYKTPSVHCSQTLSFKIFSSYERSSSTTKSNISWNYNFVHLNLSGFFFLGGGDIMQEDSELNRSKQSENSICLYLVNTVFIKDCSSETF
jgi:hypothetical protein